MSVSPQQYPIRVSSSGHYFVDALGQPFYWLGDTAWPLFTQYPYKDAEHYLTDRARKAFAVIQCVLAWSGGTGFESPFPESNEDRETPWVNDPGKPNERYFQRVDRLLEIAADLGLILAMLPTWGYFVNDTHTFNDSNASEYGRWLGRRYRNQPNVIWINGGDRIPTGFEDVYRAIALGLRDGDAGAHLITYHPCGMRSSSQFFHSEDWLDFNMIQTWAEWPRIYPTVLTDTMLSPAKPVVLGEAAYENGPEYPLGPITPLIVRRQAWWTFMAGGYFTYGQNQMWRLEPGWTSSLDTPGASQMTCFKRIATCRPWWRRVPDQSLLASGVSSERTLNAAVRSVDSDWAIIYLSSQCHVLVELDKILTLRVKATWVNPQNGDQHQAGTYDTGNDPGGIFPRPTTQWFSTPPFWEDAVLILDGI